MLPLMLLVACADPAFEAPAPSPPTRADAHAALFRKEVLEPVDGVFVAVGYGLANVIALEGPEGLVVVDTTEGRPTARAALEAIRAHTDAPIVAVILTHNHADHVFGTAVFTEGRDVPVFAHVTTSDRVDEVVSVMREAIHVRSQRMFGSPLDPADVPHAGIGPWLSFRNEDIAWVRPTHTFEDTLDVELGGLRLHLEHAPGETDDQLLIWLPDRRVLLPADNVYQAFPNLYTIRGTPYRDPMAWVRSLDRMRDLAPVALVPSHTRPVVGEQEVAELLTAYRDAIQIVHDQTIQGLNAGLGPEELAATVSLPPHLRDHPWLVEHYGRVPWAVRSVFTGMLGWFSGDPADLEPLPPAERSRRYVDALAAGRPLLEQAREAAEAGELAWATELLAHQRRVTPDNPEVRELLASVLERRAATHHNPNAAHWYLVSAGELRGEIVIPRPDASATPDEFLDGLPLRAFLDGMTTRLRFEASLDVDLRVRLAFTDVGRVFTVHVRRGVAEVRERDDPDAEVRIETTATTWKRVAARKRSAPAAWASGELAVAGDVDDVVRFLRLFEQP